ncbi:MAG TPA: hypothetical protein VF584_01265 [Longimicrobium sp.]|jgi:hypothetical protein
MASNEQIAELTTNLNTVVSHPRFAELLEQLEREPEESRKQFIRERMNPDALREQGIPVKPELRSVVRYFEDPHSAVISSEFVTAEDGTPGELRTISDVTVCASFGMGLCVSVGATLSNTAATA